LKEVNGLYEWCVFSFAYPDRLASLDLSFNCLELIPEVIFFF
jgi:hypothetical protein